MKLKHSLLVCLLPCATAIYAQQDVGTVIDEQLQYQEEAQQSQQLVEELDDETLLMISQYNRELERYEDLFTYNENMRGLIASQEQEKERLDRELQEVAVVQQALVPLMVEMVDVLGQFIELDSPMLEDERDARIQSLQNILTRSDVELSEKYRRIIESYQIEAEYGQSMEAYEDQILIQDRELTVDILRIGRVALYYLGLDREQAGIWDNVGKTWVPLLGEYIDDLDYAIRIAREQAPPNLVRLPLWTEASR